MNFNAKKGYELLQKLGVDATKLHWKDDIVFDMRLLTNYDYWECFDTSSETVPVDKIVGTCNGKYTNKSWIEMLGCLERTNDITRESAISKAKNTQFMCLNKFGDKYYISADGNHRVCLSKFLGLKTMDVGFVSHHKFNQARYDLDLSLKREAEKILENSKIEGINCKEKKSIITNIRIFFSKMLK